MRDPLSLKSLCFAGIISLQEVVHVGLYHIGLLQSFLYHLIFMVGLVEEVSFSMIPDLKSWIQFHSVT
jgi:hypothetical protein